MDPNRRREVPSGSLPTGGRDPGTTYATCLRYLPTLPVQCEHAICLRDLTTNVLGVSRTHLTLPAYALAYQSDVAATRGALSLRSLVLGRSRLWIARLVVMVFEFEDRAVLCSGIKYESHIPKLREVFGLVSNDGLSLGHQPTLSAYASPRRCPVLISRMQVYGLSQRLNAGTSITVPPYAPATRCPVLTYRMLLRRQFVLESRDSYRNRITIGGAPFSAR
eukprot:2004008-Rhodomonas_salina.1